MHIRRWGAAIVAALLVFGLLVSPAVLAKSENGKGKGQDKPTGPKDKQEEPEPVQQPEPFQEVIAFATKTGTRGVVAWQASTPISPVVTWTAAGAEPQELVVPDAPDTAGVAIIDNLTIGETYDVTLTAGDVTTVPVELHAANAYNDYAPNGTERPADDVSWRENVYTVDMLVQLDSQSLPPDVPSDLAVEDIAASVNVTAERLYDALDGHARLGNVLVTDTQFAYAVNEPFGVEEATTLTNEVNPCGADRNLADVLVQTTVPFDSHTFSYAIEEPCASYYLGRVGQLVVPWEDDLHAGYVSTHELMHYAFGAPDLYGTSNITGGGGGCRNLDWDGSLMHNSGGWNGARWELTELDRDPTMTPCDDHESEPYTWDRIQSRYTNVPDETEILDVVNYLPRGNPDGGALDIHVLDRSPASSTLSSYEPDDSNPAMSADCAGRSDPSASRATDPEGDATFVAAADTGRPEANEPALDVLATDITYVDDGTTSTTGDVLRLVITAKDLAAPPRASSHISHELRFTIGSTEYVASARKAIADGTETVAVAGVGVAGGFDVAANTVTIDIPAVLVNADGGTVYALAPGDVFAPSATWSRRVAVAVAPVADMAAGGCEIRVPGTPGGLKDPDATLTEGGAAHEWSGGPFFDTFDAGGACDVLGPCERVVLDLVPVDGSTLVVDIDVDELLATYEVSVTTPDGAVLFRDSYGTDASVEVPVPGNARYQVTIDPNLTAGGSYVATARLEDRPPPPPPPPTPPADAVVTRDAPFTATGTAPENNAAYVCDGVADPLCITYVLDVQHDETTATLTLRLEAENQLEDFNLRLFNAHQEQIAAYDLPTTHFETNDSVLVFVPPNVPPGVYYLVVEPSTVLEGTGFTVSATLS